jgi:hypothetical protein
LHCCLSFILQAMDYWMLVCLMFVFLAQGSISIKWIQKCTRTHPMGMLGNVSSPYYCSTMFTSNVRRVRLLLFTPK